MNNQLEVLKEANGKSECQDSFVECLYTMAKGELAIDRANAALNKAKSGVSGLLMEVVKKDVIKSADAFIARCEKAEAQYKLETKGKKNIPRCWTQAKSNIKRALQYGINVSEYDTESKLRKDVAAHAASIKAKEEQEKQERIEESVAYGPHARDISVGDYYGIKVKHVLNLLNEQGDASKCEDAQKIMDSMLNKLHALYLEDAKQEHEAQQEPVRAEVASIR